MQSRAVIFLFAGGLSVAPGPTAAVAQNDGFARSALRAEIAAPRPVGTGGFSTPDAAGIGTPVAAPRPRLVVVSPAASAQFVRELVDALDSDDYRVREQASRGLRQAGPAAVAPLVAAAEHGSLEVSTRALQVLQAIFVTGDDRTIDVAEQALERLKQSNNPAIAGRADYILTANYDVRERRAITEIERLGGEIHYSPFAMPDPRIPDRLRQDVGSVILGEAWRGGDAGLRFVRRLERLQILYIIDGTEAVSPAAEAQLAAEMPTLRIQHRGRACLGVGTDPVAPGCTVSQVKSGSSADRAGILAQDVIVGFGGKPVESFEGLVQLIYGYKPGDQVAVKLERNGRPVELDVVLDGWTTSGDR